MPELTTWQWYAVLLLLIVVLCSAFLAILLLKWGYASPPFEPCRVPVEDEGRPWRYADRYRHDVRSHRVGRDLVDLYRGDVR